MTSTVTVPSNTTVTSTISATTTTDVVLTTDIVYTTVSDSTAISTEVDIVRGLAKWSSVRLADMYSQVTASTPAPQTQTVHANAYGVTYVTKTMSIVWASETTTTPAASVTACKRAGGHFGDGA